MNKAPLVSVIIIFFNAEDFLSEAIESVLKQTYAHWELLLVDDGSRDGSRAIADQYTALLPGKVRVLEHPGNENRGKGATRNLGIRHATGQYLAFLDADDLWLAHKLEEQVAALEKYSEATMLYGDTLYWYSWSTDPQDRQRDFIPALRVPLDTVIEPPHLLALYLRGKAAVPCTCSIIVKRSVVERVGGFDEAFTGYANIYEDQAFYAKIVLIGGVVAIGRCWDLYRQHAQASMALALETGQEIAAREFFLRWLANYMAETGIGDSGVWQALRREQWRQAQPTWLPQGGKLSKQVRWIKKWLLRAEEHLLPLAVSRRLWSRLSK